MAQALVDHIVGEAIGEAAFMDNCLVDKLAIEVLGKFQFGTVDVDHLVGEVIGKSPDFSLVVVDHVVAECLGEWLGF
jgi:hypothetical protein